MKASLQPTKEQPDYYRRVNSLMGDYMRFLAALGYPLAPIERLLTEELTTAQVLGEDSIPTTGGDRHRPDEESDEPADSGESDATPADAPIRAEDGPGGRRTRANGHSHDGSNRTYRGVLGIHWLMEGSVPWSLW
ncbi:hypothetical protein [Nocardia beijingensis]